jgi:hypothetical protein
MVWAMRDLPIPGFPRSAPRKRRHCSPAPIKSHIIVPTKAGVQDGAKRSVGSQTSHAASGSSAGHRFTGSKSGVRPWAPEIRLRSGPRECHTGLNLDSGKPVDSFHTPGR